MERDSWKEIVYWNSKSYGNAIRIQRWKIRTFLITLGVIVPIIIPIPLMIILSKFVKKDIVWRYNNEKI